MTTAATSGVEAAARDVRREQHVEGAARLEVRVRGLALLLRLARVWHARHEAHALEVVRDDVALLLGVHEDDDGPRLRAELGVLGEHVLGETQR